MWSDPRADKAAKGEYRAANFSRRKERPDLPRQHEAGKATRAHNVMDRRGIASLEPLAEFARHLIGPP